MALVLNLKALNSLTKSLSCSHKGPSKNVNECTNSTLFQTPSPLPFKCTDQHFWFPKYGFHTQHLFVQQQKLTLILSLFDM